MVAVILPVFVLVVLAGAAAATHPVGRAWVGWGARWVGLVVAAPVVFVAGLAADSGGPVVAVGGSHSTRNPSLSPSSSSRPTSRPRPALSSHREKRGFLSRFVGAVKRTVEWFTSHRPVSPFPSHPETTPEKSEGEKGERRDGEGSPLHPPVREGKTPKDYATATGPSHPRGDSGQSTADRSLRSHTVYGQTLSMIPGLCGMTGFTHLVRRHADQGTGHGLTGGIAAAWEDAVAACATAETLADEAGSDPEKTRAARAAVEAAVDAVRDAAHLQEATLAPLFEAADATTPHLCPSPPVAAFRAA